MVLVTPIRKLPGGSLNPNLRANRGHLTKGKFIGRKIGFYCYIFCENFQEI